MQVRNVGFPLTAVDSETEATCTIFCLPRQIRLSLTPHMPLRFGLGDLFCRGRFIDLPNLQS